MKKLKELIACDYDILIKGIKTNSSEVEEGDLFVCIDVGTTDRHLFIDDAIKKGAVAIIAKHTVGQKSVPVIITDPNKVLPEICAKFYDYPNQKLKMIGVTGTDGKTSISTMLQILMGSDKCGYIGTNGYNCAKFMKDTQNTTPNCDKLFGYFQEFLDAGCTACSMEVSSEALIRGRVDGIDYDISIISNITSEHLNVHGNLENYIKAKCLLFQNTKKTGYCLLNADDEHFNEVKKCCKGHVLTYGTKKDCDLYFYNIDLSPVKTIFNFKYKGQEYTVTSPYPGLFNVYNLCASILAMFALGYDYADFEKNIANIKVSGRLEMIDEGQDFYVMVDYAHTPNGIAKLLEYVHMLPIKRSIVVTGQAGGRDPYKRHDVGRIAVMGASHVIFTYEDPRNEDPRAIIEMMIADVKDRDNYEIVIDRAEAIKKAINMAKPQDMVLILGKGNESYEKIKNEVIHFNDIEEARKYLKERLLVKN